MRFASAVSEQAQARRAVDEAGDALLRQLDGAEPDLVLVFASGEHTPAFDQLPGWLRRKFPRALVLGCSAGGVIGAGREVEERPGLSLTAATLPKVTLRPFYVEARGLPADDAPRERWQALVGAPPEERPTLLLLPDPFTCEADRLVAGIDAAFPGAVTLGGLASGAHHPGVNALFLGERTLRDGAVGVALSGPLAVDTIVAQGCRPIGVPMPVTRCQHNVVLELGGRAPVEVLRELYESLGERDRALFRDSLFVGLEMNADRMEYREGELLARNLVGVDPERGAMAVGAMVRPWQVLQFLLRDANTAREDLERLLERYQAEGKQPRGALLFSCLGRGKNLYGRPDHDTDLFRERIGDVPLGGFFCNGEIGPVGGTTFLHGYTSAFGLFREPCPSRRR